MAKRVPLDLEVTEETGATATSGAGSCSTPRTPCRSPPTCWYPRTGRAGSAVLAVHGHGPGKSLVCGLEPEGAPGSDYAAELARRGHVVLAPDLRCFGERADWNPPDHYGCDTNLVHQVMGGWSPLTQNLWDLSRAWMCSRVIPGRPGSDRPGRALLRGTVTLFLAAWTNGCRLGGVRLPLLVGEAHKVPWNMCGSQVLSGCSARWSTPTWGR